MDLASFIGIISGITLILSAIILGGDLHNFIDIPSVMIVLGGTIATTLLTFQFQDVLAAFRAAYFIFSQEKQDPNDIVQGMVKLCDISRKDGIHQLENIDTPYPFLKKACGLIADNASEVTIRSALRTEIESLKLRHFIVQDVFRKMGTYAPAFGMIGTVIGLVQMLSKLQDPSNIGPAMATALITTFYGSILSTLLFLPIAGKLKARTVLEVINMEIMLEGTVSILERNHPLILYERLSSFIPERNRKPFNEMKVKA
ncbi:MAG: MotA/TolQ/ExbB proton channel family protein [Desulfobacterales bacterium]|nr:MotA/TolQ/ExbB proton channel family protein [Desulfobacterales bacterium]